MAKHKTSLNVYVKFALLLSFLNAKQNDD